MDERKARLRALMDRIAGGAGSEHDHAEAALLDAGLAVLDRHAPDLPASVRAVIDRAAELLFAQADEERGRL